MSMQDPARNNQQPLLSSRQMVIKPVEQVLCPEAVRLLAQIRHPALPALRGVEEIELEDQKLKACFLFDFLPGTSLDRLTTEETTGWPLLAKIAFFAELAHVIDFLHDQCEPGLLHLDLKPANILLGPDLRPRLIDFGAAQVLKPRQSAEICTLELSVEETRSVACTPVFAAPEVFRGLPCRASDLYSLGMTMLTVLSSITQVDDPKTQLPELLSLLPPALSGILHRCLQTMPADRYASASELALDLEQCVERLTLPADPREDKAETEKPNLENASEEASALGKEATAAMPLATSNTSRLLCVWDGAEFGCELAVALRDYYAQVLVIDCDLMNPQADLLLGKRNRPDFSAAVRSGDNLNQAFKDIACGALTSRRLHDLAWPSLADQVDLIVFGDKLDEYDHIQPDGLIKLLEIARMSYPVIVLLCNRFIYDAFTCLGLMTADQVLIPATGDVATFRSFNRAIDFLDLRRQIEPERVSFVAFPYDERTDLSLGTLDVLCRRRLIGSVRVMQNRQRQKGSAKPYALSVSSLNAKEYDGIIARLGAMARKEDPHANRHLSRPVRRTIRFLSRQANPAQ